MVIDSTSQPLQVFNEWMHEAKNTPAIREPTAMALATSNGKDLSVRVVLCKEWSERGFVFFTNYASHKGRDLNANPNVASVFYWDPLFRQVKIAGVAQKVAREESTAYWSSRPRESQLSQFISRQSEVTASREALEQAWREADERFRDRPIPCPEHWGGYVIVPSQIEFWIGRPGRLHDRFVFEKSAGTWTFRRLCP